MVKTKEKGRSVTTVGPISNSSFSESTTIQKSVAPRNTKNIYEREGEKEVKGQPARESRSKKSYEREQLK